jgi:hypothetical protein
MRKSAKMEEGRGLRGVFIKKERQSNSHKGLSRVDRARRCDRTDNPTSREAGEQEGGRRRHKCDEKNRRKKRGSRQEIGRKRDREIIRGGENREEFEGWCRPREEKRGGTEVGGKETEREGQ